MEPYANHYEYMLDIQKLMDLKIEAFKNSYDHMHISSVLNLSADIKSRVAISRCMLPIEHIKRVFRLNDMETHLLCALFLYENNEKYRKELEHFLENGLPYCLDELAPLSCIEGSAPYSIYELLDISRNGRFLKEEITAFIVSPGWLIERAWFEYYYSSESKLIFEEKNKKDFLSLVSFCANSDSPIPYIISVIGKRGSGRKSLIRMLGTENSLPIVFVNCQVLSAEGDIFKAADEIKMLGILTEGAICLSNADCIVNDNSKIAVILQKLRKITKFMFITLSGGIIDFADLNYNAVEYIAPPLGSNAAFMIWEAECGKFNNNGNLDFMKLANMYTLTPKQIKSAIMGACIAAHSASRELMQSDLTEACRDAAIDETNKLGKIIVPIFKWDDVVLPKKQKEAFSDAFGRIKFRKRVFGDWQFEKIRAYGAGVHILLHGPSGTGKTMAALAFAGELGFAVYKIDLSQVISKYIGETEKSLSRVFEEAENSNCLLFFDEADSLFGRRTEIKDSHDRHANMQASFLLQKIEDYSGVVILATNMIRNIDDAFKRRFQFIIDIPMPDKELRRSIWQKSFPSETPLDADVDFDYLSELEINGSLIKNAALSAAFYSAQMDKTVGMDEIFKAVRNEVEKYGGVAVDYLC